ncbi:MAG: BPTI/Kunitz domain-containing protein [Myxococcales bacterium]|nr:BPTI/Kunitz domain-containing protein [Myxococcales bacterium]
MNKTIFDGRDGIVRSKRWLLGALVALWALGCGAHHDGGGDSESHFLTTCDSRCQAGLSCICGVCTRSCDDDATCTDLAQGASCEPHGGDQGLRCDGADTPRAEPVTSCELECKIDTECSQLGANMRCEAGLCRQRPGLDAGLDAGTDAGMQSDAGPAPDAGSDAGPQPDAASDECSQAAGLFAMELADAQRCELDSECGAVLSGSSCGCTRDLVLRNDADDGELQRLLELAHPVTGERCLDSSSDCDCPEADGFICKAGRCNWNYADPGPLDCCTNRDLRWRYDGGELPPEAPTRPSYRVAGCGSFEKLRDDQVECASALPACGQDLRIGPDALSAVLQHADVVSALAAAPALFGEDTRPVDGAILLVSIDGLELLIGEPCDGLAGCTEIPAGIARLQQTLLSLGRQQLATGVCTAPESCYLPADIGPCDAVEPRFFYDESVNSCTPFTWGGCDGNANRFETYTECVLSCDNDPCAGGLRVDTPEQCEANQIEAEGRCFDDALSGCLCACSRTGAALEQCAINESAPASATCGG